MSELLIEAQSEATHESAAEEIGTQRSGQQSGFCATLQDKVGAEESANASECAMRKSPTLLSPHAAHVTLPSDDPDQTNGFLSPAGATSSISVCTLSQSAEAGTVQAKKRLRDETVCVICLEMMKDPYLTTCGHTFCFECIGKHLEFKSVCPNCRTPLSKENIFPNMQLKRLVKRIENSNKSQKLPPFIQELYSRIGGRVTPSQEIDFLLVNLTHKKAHMDIRESTERDEALLDFLQKALSSKERELSFLKDQVQRLLEDFNEVQSLREKEHSQHHEKECLLAAQSLNPHLLPTPSTSQSPSHRQSWSTLGFQQQCCPFSKSYVSARQEILVRKRERLAPHIEDLMANYVERRQSDPKENVGQICSTVDQMTKHGQLKVLSVIKNTELHNTSIVSSIEFDRDDEFFAAAGTNKKIRIYSFENIIGNPKAIHQPLQEITGRYKISCLSYSPNSKEHIASSDYDGSVIFWNCESGKPVRQFKEHEKRVWSINFSRSEYDILASGSDDCKVKVWSLRQEQSVLTMEAKANVCCVEFNPENPYMLAFGSADHLIHYYDIRKPKEAVSTFQQHRKAVSYVKFLSGRELVSASTDCTLRTWDLLKNECIQTYSGHVNEKNFVGLYACNEYIACGSEDNSVYYYHKSSPKPLMVHRYGSSQGGDEIEEDGNLFVSSVRIRSRSNHLLAANSQGSIKILQPS